MKALLIILFINLNIQGKSIPHVNTSRRVGGTDETYFIKDNKAAIYLFSHNYRKSY